MCDGALHDLEGESQDASGRRHVLSQPLGLGPHQPQDLCFGTVGHSPLQQGLQGLSERWTETMMSGEKPKADNGGETTMAMRVYLVPWFFSK